MVCEGFSNSRTELGKDKRIDQHKRTTSVSENMLTQAIKLTGPLYILARAAKATTLTACPLHHCCLTHSSLQKFDGLRYGL